MSTFLLCLLIVFPLYMHILWVSLSYKETSHIGLGVTLWTHLTLITSSKISAGLPLWLKWWRVGLQSRRPGFDPWVGKIPWRREWLTHSSILAWRIPRTEEPSGLQSTGSQRVGHDWKTNPLSIFYKPVSTSSAIRHIWIRTYLQPIIYALNVWQILSK